MSDTAATVAASSTIRRSCVFSPLLLVFVLSEARVERVDTLGSIHACMAGDELSVFLRDAATAAARSLPHLAFCSSSVRAASDPLGAPRLGTSTHCHGGPSPNTSRSARHACPGTGCCAAANGLPPDTLCGEQRRPVSARAGNLTM